ncbi:alpha/beta hydrolase family protein [Streptomyces sp. NPDC002144]
MSSVHFTTESSAHGMRERDFTLGDIPGILWSPLSGADRAPLVLMGHGGGTHKKWPAMSGRARLLVARGFHVAVIDAPGHGERPRTAYAEQEIAELYRAREAGEPEGPIVVRYNAHLAERAVPEWRATLDALCASTTVSPSITAPPRGGSSPSARYAGSSRSACAAVPAARRPRAAA